MSNKQKRNKPSFPVKKQISKEDIQEIKSKFWDIKDDYPTLKTFAASLVQFCAYTVLASAGVFIRIVDTGVNPTKFWFLVGFGAVLSTIPVFMFRYKFVLSVSFLLCIALGITSGNYAESSKGVDINSFYYVDLFAVAMMLILGYMLWHKLASLNVKRPQNK